MPVTSSTVSGARRREPAKSVERRRSQSARTSSAKTSSSRTNSSGKKTSGPALAAFKVTSALLSVSVVAGAVVLHQNGKGDALAHGVPESTPTSAGRIATNADLPRPPRTASRSKRTTPTPTPRQTSEEPNDPTNPGGKPIPERGTGRLLGVAGEVAPREEGRDFVYRLEIESGLPLDREAVADKIQSTLVDKRGWQDIKHVAFGRTYDGERQFKIILASPETTDKLCYPLDTGGEVSCRQKDRVVLNAKRWALGVPDFRGNLDLYRSYLINHEVGHALGEDHVTCHGAGQPAPVMMQQTKGVGECKPNPWPVIQAR